MSCATPPRIGFIGRFAWRGAEGRTLTFQFQPKRLGYFGPAVSHDLEHWHWLNRVDGNSFTYRFGADEKKVYFAHSMLYHPARFINFADRHHMPVEKLCTGYKGSDVPCIRFGEGEISVILTARHHACESTGSYVLEGVLSELIANPIAGTKVLCVPFVDYEGVIRGDQGKSRAPHDHNRDYSHDEESIYPECAAIKKYAEQNGCHFGFDFHSPGHISKENDHVFIVQNSIERLDRLNKFGEYFEKSITENALKYSRKNDYPPETGWNHGGAQFSNYMRVRKENHLTFSLETTYFGTFDNKVDEPKLLELGSCFANALRNYIGREYE